MTDAIDMAEVDRIVAAVGSGREGVIPILRGVQERFHYLPESALRRIVETTDISAAAITGVATFYSQFRLRPAGRHTVRVCVGTACHVKGAGNVYDAICRHLRLSDGEDTDDERLFTVEKVACLGCCMLAPVVQIDDVTYGHVEPPTVPRVLADFLLSQGAARAADGRAASGRLSERGEVRLCECSSCCAAGAATVAAEVKRCAREAGLGVSLKTVGCTGMSFEAPLLEVVPTGGGRFRYGQVAAADVKGILLRHFRPQGLAGKVTVAVTGVLDRLLTDEEWVPVTRYSVDVRDEAVVNPYVSSQTHLVMEHCGEMDPLDLDDYLAHAGFEALKRCLHEYSPEWILEQVEASALKGRGGAGFPAAVKWTRVHGMPGDTKYIVCNGDEGDPGAFMDRMILESFPFRVIEGMAIAAFAVGASEGVFYVRAEYPLATRRVAEAIRLCEERGILGDDVMGSGRALQFRVVEGAGAFVCGEETALIAAIEGRRGLPRFRPPYPSDHGLWDRPTLVNNTETLALVPWIIREGADAFVKLGTHGSRGTKTFALAGKVLRGGLIEVPMGMTLREIVEDVGGGIQGGHALKAVQVGGPSGGCVPASLADTPVDYEALVSAGAMMGSGGLVVLDDTDCMVDMARYFLAFTQHESCGKCTHCRIGTKRMLEILEGLCAGEGRPGDIERLEELAAVTRQGSLCGLGRTAPNPVLSTLQHFRSEYDAHLAGRCPAGKCKALIRYTINDDCIGCTRCAQRCPTDAIAAHPYHKHEIDPDKCTRCDTCRQVCPVGAVVVM